MRHTLTAISVLAVLASCSSHDAEMPFEGVEEQVSTVSVLCQSRTAAAGILTGADGDASDDGQDGKEDTSDRAFGDILPIINDSFEEGNSSDKTGSLLYFSQQGPESEPNFSDDSEDVSPYLYIYEYKKNEEEAASWEKGYNFSKIKDRKPLNWRDVKTLGSVGNAFSMYAFYFPVDNKTRVRDKRFYVEKDQRGPDTNPYDESNFRKSDIMGAYHATSLLYTRLRFRLFHLMVYLKVTLYVPVYDDTVEWPEDGNIDNTDMKYSGFKEGAVKNAYVLDADTDFSIEWRANRSSDTEAPLTQSAGNKANIIMYQHKPDNEICEEFNVKDYYTNDNITDDRVRAYNFSVLFPSQPFANNSNFLCFELETPDGSYKYYYFSANQIVGDKSANFGLTQGTLQQLYLYLPRKENETILVGAKILDWAGALTDMTVTKDPSGGDDQSAAGGGGQDASETPDNN